VVAKKLSIVLLGITGFAAASACAFHRVGSMGERDVETPVTIRGTSADPKKCVVTSKEAEVRVHKDKWFELKFSNYCESPATASVGNFRTTENPSGLPAHCDSPYFGNPTAIFRETDPQDFKVRIDEGMPNRPDSEKIKLKVKTRGELGNEQLVYYFDICVDGVKQTDPRIIIER
jgi:hypothetical protein